MNQHKKVPLVDCFVCERHISVDTFCKHTKSKKHRKLLNEAHGLARFWIKVTGHPSIYVKEDLLRTIFQTHGKIMRILCNNETYYIRFLKIKSAFCSLQRGQINYKTKDNLHVSLRVMPVMINPQRPLEVDVFHLESENNEMDDFRRILSHSIRSIQPSSSTQPVSFENIANDIVNTVLAHAHNDAGSSLVYSELSRMLREWRTILQRDHGMHVNVKVYVFGSVEIGLSLSRFSDIDVYLDVGDFCFDMLHETTKILWANQDQFHDIISIKGARVPIVKAVHSASDIPLDISFKSKLGWYNTQLIKFYVKYDERVKTLLALIKIWFKRADLNGPRAFTSYSIYWLCLFYLQQLNPPLIPTVHQLMQFYPTTSCLEWQVVQSEEVLSSKMEYPAAQNKTCLQDLFLGFFKFYQNKDLRDSVLCPLLGRELPRAAFELENLSQLPLEMNSYCKYAQEFPRDLLKISSQICIQDPYDLTHNITKAVTHATVSLLMHHIETLWILLRREPHRVLVACFEDQNRERDARLTAFDAENEGLRLKRLLAACEERKQARDIQESEKARDKKGRESGLKEGKGGGDSEGKREGESSNSRAELKDREMSSNKLAGLSSNKLTGLSSNKLTGLSSSKLAGLSSNKLAGLSSNNLAGLSTQNQGRSGQEKSGSGERSDSDFSLDKSRRKSPLKARRTLVITNSKIGSPAHSNDSASERGMGSLDKATSNKDVSASGDDGKMSTPSRSDSSVSECKQPRLVEGQGAADIPGIPVDLQMLNWVEQKPPELESLDSLLERLSAKLDRTNEKDAESVENSNADVQTISKCETLCNQELQLGILNPNRTGNQQSTPPRDNDSLNDSFNSPSGLNVSIGESNNPFFQMFAKVANSASSSSLNPLSSRSVNPENNNPVNLSNSPPNQLFNIQFNSTNSLPKNSPMNSALFPPCASDRNSSLNTTQAVNSQQLNSEKLPLSHVMNGAINFATNNSPVNSVRVFNGPQLISSNPGSINPTSQGANTPVSSTHTLPPPPGLQPFSAMFPGPTQNGFPVVSTAFPPPFPVSVHPQFQPAMNHQVHPASNSPFPFPVNSHIPPTPSTPSSVHSQLPQFSNSSPNSKSPLASTSVTETLKQLAFHSPQNRTNPRDLQDVSNIEQQLMNKDVSNIEHQLINKDVSNIEHQLMNKDVSKIEQHLMNKDVSNIEQHLMNKDVSNIEQQLMNKDVSNIEHQLINKDVSNIEHQLFRNQKEKTSHTWASLLSASSPASEQNRPIIPSNSEQSVPRLVSDLDIDAKLQNLKDMIGTARTETGIVPLKQRDKTDVKMKFIDVSTLEMNLRGQQDNQISLRDKQISQISTEKQILQSTTDKSEDTSSLDQRELGINKINHSTNRVENSSCNKSSNIRSPAENRPNQTYSTSQNATHSKDNNSTKMDFKNQEKGHQNHGTNNSRDRPKHHKNISSTQSTSNIARTPSNSPRNSHLDHRGTTYRSSFNTKTKPNHTSTSASYTSSVKSSPSKTVWKDSITTLNSSHENRTKSKDYSSNGMRQPAIDTTNHIPKNLEKDNCNRSLLNREDLRNPRLTNKNVTNYTKVNDKSQYSSRSSIITVQSQNLHHENIARNHSTRKVQEPVSRHLETSNNTNNNATNVNQTKSNIVNSRQVLTWAHKAAQESTSSTSSTEAPINNTKKEISHAISVKNPESSVDKSTRESSVNSSQTNNSSSSNKLLSSYIFSSHSVDGKQYRSFYIRPTSSVNLYKFFPIVIGVLLDYLQKVCRVEVHIKKYLNETEYLIRGTHNLDLCQKRKKLLKEAKFDPPRSINHSKFQVEILKSNFLLMNAPLALTQSLFDVSLKCRLVLGSENPIQVNFANENVKMHYSQWVNFLAFLQNAFDVINKELTARYLGQ